MSVWYGCGCMSVWVYEATCMCVYRMMGGRGGDVTEVSISCSWSVCVCDPLSSLPVAESVWVYSLNFWCLNPAVVSGRSITTSHHSLLPPSPSLQSFSQLSCARSVVLTSGTLSPLSSFSSGQSPSPPSPPLTSPPPPPPPPLSPPRAGYGLQCSAGGQSCGA